MVVQKDLTDDEIDRVFHALAAATRRDKVVEGHWARFVREATLRKRTQVIDDVRELLTVQEPNLAKKFVARYAALLETHPDASVAVEHNTWMCLSANKSSTKLRSARVMPAWWIAKP